MVKSREKSRRITLRPIRDDDWEFVYQVYASTRERELQALPWSVEEKEDFLRFQFHAQRTHYEKHFANAEFLIIELSAKPIGRLYIDRRRDEIRLVDIALLSAYQGKGIGGQLMADILAEGEREGLLVRIHVEHDNPAKHLYDRLGFRKIEEQGVYWLMEWTPPNLPNLNVAV